MAISETNSVRYSEEYSSRKLFVSGSPTQESATAHCSHSNVVASVKAMAQIIPRSQHKQGHEIANEFFMNF